VILKSETYHFHRLDLTRQAGFIVTIYDEDGLRRVIVFSSSIFRLNWTVWSAMSVEQSAIKFVTAPSSLRNFMVQASVSFRSRQTIQIDHQLSEQRH
jgi:hypothetical protein